MLSALPSDVIRDIARWLPQNELLSFAFTCKQVYGAVHDQIYQSVTIDSTRRVFNDEIPTKDPSGLVDITESVYEPVVIRSLFALKRFFKTLIAHPEDARHVHVLVARDEFPDIPEYELYQLLTHVFPLLSNLHILNWYSTNCPLHADLLALLPYPQYLHSLCGNFQNIGSGLPKNDFFTLRHVDFSNSGSVGSIQQIDPARFPNVESLTLSRTVSTNRLLFSSQLRECCESSVDSRTENMVSILGSGKSPKYISTLFTPSLQIPLSLRSLVLRDICLTMEDARILLHNIDFSRLEHLSLENCFEILFENETLRANQVQITRRSPPPLTFLDVLSDDFQNLSSLNIGLFNEMCYNSATFKAISGLRGLTKLSIHVKNFCRNGPVSLAPLIESFQSHKDTLQYLSICSDVVEQFASPFCPKKRNRYELDSIVGLTNLIHLKIVRIPVAYSQINELPQILSPLKNIEIIQLLITDFESVASSASCNGCPNSVTYALCNTNSLIAQEYFNCANSFTTIMEVEKNQHYHQFASNYRDIFQSLSYLRFDMNNQSMVFGCRNPRNIELKDQTYVEKFDSLVNQHLD
ncbi:hypothetical protein JCM33374_g3957 [Metschnikowia sp. JCM 33374]|nr:hypothetical protein JCM33374_g3957 [Metschnikowia sp. JCM 33374]